MTRITHIGGPTVLIEVDGWRLPTDATFDPHRPPLHLRLGSSSWKLTGPAKPPIQVTATPCRHGLPLSRPVAGAVVGFALGWEGQGARGAVDHRRHRALRRPPPGRRPPPHAIPVHYEGWTHFHQGRTAIQQELHQAPADIVSGSSGYPSAPASPSPGSTPVSKWS